MAGIQPKKPPVGSGVRSWSRRVPRYVLGIYCRRWLRRKIANTKIMMPEIISDGIRVETKVEAELEAFSGFSSSCNRHVRAFQSPRDSGPDKRVERQRQKIRPWVRFKNIQHVWPPSRARGSPHPGNPWSP